MYLKNYLIWFTLGASFSTLGLSDEVADKENELSQVRNEVELKSKTLYETKQEIDQRSKVVSILNRFESKTVRYQNRLRQLFDLFSKLKSELSGAVDSDNRRLSALNQHTNRALEKIESSNLTLNEAKDLANLYGRQVKEARVCQADASANIILNQIREQVFNRILVELKDYDFELRRLNSLGEDWSEYKRIGRDNLDKGNEQAWSLREFIEKSSFHSKTPQGCREFINLHEALKLNITLTKLKKVNSDLASFKIRDFIKKVESREREIQLYRELRLMITEMGAVMEKSLQEKDIEDALEIYFSFPNAKSAVKALIYNSPNFSQSRKNELMSYAEDIEKNIILKNESKILSIKGLNQLLRDRTRKAHAKLASLNRSLPESERSGDWQNALAFFKDEIGMTPSRRFRYRSFEDKEKLLDFSKKVKVGIKLLLELER
ncbi:MAG: hypothetical protein HRU19_23790 [Pseudobacteriovorax sp.]|nr:hypothetical protein [Pseudobacteriovorax sp.]